MEIELTLSIVSTLKEIILASGKWSLGIKIKLKNLNKYTQKIKGKPNLGNRPFLKSGVYPGVANYLYNVEAMN